MDEPIESEMLDFDAGLDEEPYQPLARPSGYSTIPPKVEAKPDLHDDEDGECSSASSECDSDEDKSFQKRIKVEKRQSKQSLNKYNVWSNRAQEDSLLETFNNCDVTYVNRSRNVETYDYTISDDFTHKRDRKRKYAKKRGASGGKSDEDESPEPRNILELSEGHNEKSDEDLAVEISNKLLEEKEDLIRKIVSVIGREKSIEIFNKVRDIETDGGMQIVNGNRRKTPGGVFMTLVKQDRHITREQTDLLFKEDYMKYRDQLKAKRRQKNDALKQQIHNDRLSLIEQKKSDPKSDPTEKMD